MNIISGLDYPTLNLFLSKVFMIKEVLDKNVKSDDDFIRCMIGKMKETFDKY